MSSKENRRLRRTAFSKASDALVREVGVTSRSNADLAKELKARVPGRDPEEYEEAIARSIYYDR